MEAFDMFWILLIGIVIWMFNSKITPSEPPGTFRSGKNNTRKGDLIDYENEDDW